ncbi:MAG: hypothetical protein IKK43_02345 [Clostridia bacterium]|nr:hypothetical protein [Clostridia bacterium]
MAKYCEGNVMKLLKNHGILEKGCKYTDVAWSARCLLEKIDERNVTVSENCLIIRPALDEVINHPFADDNLRAVENELAAELKDIFGVEADVKYKLEYTEEVEPDPVPPLYWGGTDTHYHYSLTIKIKLPE